MDTEVDLESIEAAAAWFAQLRSAPPSPSQQASFRVWLAADLRHVRAMDAVDAAWRQTAVLAASHEAPGGARRDRKAAASSPGRAPSKLRSRRLFVAASALAACLCAAVMAPALWNRVYAPVTYQALAGAPLATTLSDGSVMTLEAGGAAVVRMTPTIRQIDLVRGAGEYQVAHGQPRPFVVSDGRISVRATGTRFTVRRGAARSDVVLAEGSVDLIDPASRAVRAQMKPGEHAVVLEDGRLRVTRDAAPAVSVEGDVVLEFDRTSLRDALAQFNAGSATKATLGDPALGDIEISGVYRRADLTAFLEGLTRIEDVTWRRSRDGTIVIDRGS